MQEKLEKGFGLIVVLVPTIHKARSIRTMTKWPFINNVLSKLAIFDPLPLLLAGGRSLCTNSSFGLPLSTIKTTSFMNGPKPSHRYLYGDVGNWERGRGQKLVKIAGG